MPENTHGKPVELTDAELEAVSGGQNVTVTFTGGAGGAASVTVTNVTGGAGGAAGTNATVEIEF